MRILFGLLTIALASSVYAMEPPPSVTTPATSTSQPAAETTADASSSSTKAPAADSKANPAPKLVLTAGDSAAAAELKRLKAAGYTPEAHGDEIWFCRKEAPLGSRLEKKICNTADELLHQAADAREQTDKITRRISGDPRTPPGQR
jgi:hypothetical protein